MRRRPATHRPAGKPTARQLPAVAALVSMALLAALALASASAASAQGNEQGASTFFETVDVDLINVEVFVTDKKGNSITGLKRDDFEILVDGKPATIDNFYSEVLGRPAVDLPEAPANETAPVESAAVAGPSAEEQRLHLIVLVDNSHIRPPNRKRVFNALRQFLDSSLGAEDVVSVVSLNRSTFVHNDFMNDRRIIDRVLDEVQTAAAEDLGGEIERRRIFSEVFRRETTGRGQFNQSTVFNSRALLSSIRTYAEREYNRTRQTLDAMGAFVDTLGGIPGRKAMIHVSDGVPNKPGEDLFLAYATLDDLDNVDANSNPNFHNDYETDVGRFDLFEHFRELGRRANASQVTLYALDAEASHTARARSAAVEGFIPSEVLSTIETNYRQPMEMLAVATGGQRIQSSPRLLENLASITTDFNTFYSLGFQAPDDKAGSRHRIEVKVPGRKDLVLRHRDNYRRKNQDQRTGDSTIAALLYNAINENSMGIVLEPLEPQPREDGNTVLPLRIKVPVRSIVLLPRGEVHGAQLSLFVSTKDKAGNARPVQKVPFHLNIPTDKLEEARQHSAEYVLSLVIRPGDQQVAIGVRDDVAATESTLRLDLLALLGRS